MSLPASACPLREEINLRQIALAQVSFRHTTHARVLGGRRRDTLAPLHLDLFTASTEEPNNYIGTKYAKIFFIIPDQDAGTEPLFSQVSWMAEDSKCPKN